MEKKDKIGYHIYRKAEWQIQNNIETSGNSYHIEASQLIYIANQFTGSARGVFLLKGFSNILPRFLSLVVEKKIEIYL